MLQLPPAEELQGDVREILSEPEFVVVGESPLARAMGLVWGWLRDLFRFLFPSDVEVGPVEWVSRVVALLAIITVGVVVARLLRARRAGRSPRKGRSEHGAPEPEDPASWVRWARQRAEEGRYREAATGLYQAALLQLDQGGVLTYRNWKTPGDYADEVSRDDPRGKGFLDFLRLFLAVAFGADEASAGAVQKLEAQVLALGVRA